MKGKTNQILSLLVAIIVINIIASHYYFRFDLTEDKRYTLSNTTTEIVENVEEILQINVYLKGNFPAEFKRLQTETLLHLEELKAKNSNIHFKFINPSKIGQKLIDKGLTPSNLQVLENGNYTELTLFPWAVIEYKNKRETVPLLTETNTASQEEQLQKSIQNLEFAFANALHKVTSKKSKKIAVLKGNGQLDDIYLADFLTSLGEYYLLAPFTLDSVANNPKKTLNQLTDYDLAIIAKPTEKFSEKEKFTLDQFVMNGGKSIWLIDNVQAELDSLMQTGETLAYPRDLGVTDMFFNYGFRLTNNLVTDLYSSQITLATGKVGNRTQFNAFPWKYYPLVQNTNSHPITNNIGPVNFKFAVAIDTLKNNIQKHILLQSSKLSKAVGTPSIVSLKSISNKENQNSFTKGNFPLALLLEGEFKSAYAGRVKPFSIENSKDKSVTNQLIVIGDGDLIANDVAQGKPLPLGYDKWTNEQYGNKNFLINCVNYLLDDKDLVSLRNKTVKIQFLNKQKAFDEALKWRIVNILVPLLILGVFGLLFNYFRKKKYQ